MRESFRIRRRKRKIKKATCFITGVAIIVFVILVINANKKYVRLDLNKYVTLSLEGYDGKGTAKISYDGEGVRTELMEGYGKFSRNPFHFYDKTTAADYDELYRSIHSDISETENLSNGQELLITYSYNKELAKKLKVTVVSDESPIIIQDLKEAKVISKEDLFRDVDVTMSGIAPNLSVKIENKSKDPFLETVQYKQEQEGVMHYLGESVKVSATLDDDLAERMGYRIDTAANDRVKDYVVNDVDSYVTEISQLPQELVDQIVTKGASLINGTKCEHGLRVFTEAHIDYNLAGVSSPFTYSGPRVLSMYLKSLKTDANWVEGYDFNNLDVIYEVTITQAGGMSCQAEAAVRVRNLIKRKDGTIEADIDSVEIATVSHDNKSILKNVTDFYEKDYSVEKKRL